MGWFTCNRCGMLANSDDGCSEDPFDEYGLICSDCEVELDANYDLVEDCTNDAP